MDAATRGGSSGVSAVVEYDYTAKEPDELDLVKGAVIHSIKQMSGGWWEGTLQSNGRTGMFPDNFVRLLDTNEESTVVLRDKSATSNRRCKVIYSYTQVNDDELSLGVGDVIEFLGEVEEGWWRGRLKNKVGVFPSNFVVAIEPSPILASKRPPSSTIANTTSIAKFPATASSNSVSSMSSSSTAATSTTVNTVVNNISTVAAATTTLSSLSSSSSSTTTTSNKKTNRLSFHSSKEDLLHSAATSLDDVPPSSAPSLPPKPQRDFCRVEFPYAPANDDELELKSGDIISVISMELPDKGWWKGELRGKVGVFPDNFVKLLPPSEVSPLNDSQITQKVAKNSNSTATAGVNASSANTKSNLAAGSTSSKVFIKKSGSTSSTQSVQAANSNANRKDSFGSRDSLNDILSETGLQSGNVAATRKSLENKNLDLLNAPDASSRLLLKKQQQQQQQQQETILTVVTASSTISSSATSSTNNNTSTGSSSNVELRKSLENMDEKTKTPPPVLTKKPLLGTKGGLLSGLKMKVKNVEKQLSASSATHDFADGLGSSKMSSSSTVAAGLPEASVSGNVVMRRSATIAVEDSYFDSVERASLLPDVRAGRVKAPRRRPPSAAYNLLSESNSNNAIYINGSGGGGDGGEADTGDVSTDTNADANKTQSSDDNSTGDEQLAKPKPRDWQKQKAPWMAELKATQVKKKTSPNVEPRAASSSSSNTITTNATASRQHITEDTKITSSSSLATSGLHSSIISSSSTSTSSAAASSSTTATTSTKVQSSSISSTLMQQSMTAESSSSSIIGGQQQLLRNSQLSGDSMSKSLANAKHMLSADGSDDVLRIRPNSLALRNRSTSPAATRNSSAAAVATKTTASPATSTSNNANVAEAASTSSNIATVNAATAAKSTHNSNSNSSSSNNTNNSIYENNLSATTAAAVGGTRVLELEKRVEKLESVVQTQQRTIDELVRTLREETDRVKLLRGELDKYAQCVTQV